MSIELGRRCAGPSEFLSGGRSRFRDQGAMGRIQRHHGELAEAGGKDHRRRLRIGPDVELGRRRYIADLVAAAHQHHFRHALCTKVGSSASAAAMLVSGAHGNQRDFVRRCAIGLDQEFDRAPVRLGERRFRQRQRLSP